MCLTVLLALGDSSEPHMACLSGLQDYVEKHDLGWGLIFGSSHHSQAPRDDLIVVGHFLDSRDAPPSGVSNQPTITLFGSASEHFTPCLAFDDEAFGALAAQHLQELGYRHACLIETPKIRRLDPDSALLRQRHQGFAEACTRMGIRLTTFEHEGPHQDKDLLDWLCSAGASVGIYCPNDGRASWLRHQILKTHGSFPKGLAIVGTGNHVHTCMEEQPHLTSISYPWRSMGYAVGRWIHRFIHSEEVPEPIRLRPLQVVRRNSTPPVQLPDPLARKAAAWLKRHLSSPAPLRDVVQALDCSQVALSRRFRKATGTSPKQYHEQMRLMLAIELLTDPALSITDIAKRTGYRSRVPFTVAFTRRYGCSPSAWRQGSKGS